MAIDQSSILSGNGINIGTQPGGKISLSPHWTDKNGYLPIGRKTLHIHIYKHTHTIRMAKTPQILKRFTSMDYYVHFLISLLLFVNHL